MFKSLYKFLAPDEPQPPGPSRQPSREPSSVTDVVAEIEQEKEKAGVLVSAELEATIERARRKVDSIVKECRARNSKFRDIEFDLEEDRERCLHGLNTPLEERSNPMDVRRVTSIFSDPQFFVDGAHFSDVNQGELGDCWVLSGLSTVSTMSGLIEKICVAWNAQVGVYAFVFHRDGVPVEVIIDDFLFTKIPKWEELTDKEQSLYHFNRQKYNRLARGGSKSLYFAQSGTDNETWGPLLEKAYAKLHGDYASLNSGIQSEAIEDMTGGVSTIIHVNDILDTDLFWKEQLLRTNEDCLFGCSIYSLREGTFGNPPPETVSGLYTRHAYSIIKAVEYKDKRFLRIRNPWGDTEWTGPWSDGSKEWTQEWLEALEVLGHTFGDDGSFIMEYEDFLDTWTLVGRTRLFDPSWVVSSLWINAAVRGNLSAWDFGDVSFTFSIPTASPVVIVLAQLDDRYFKEISGIFKWTMDFRLYKKGDSELLASSSHSTFYRRSVNTELELEEGEYVVHVRLDRMQIRPKDYLATNAPSWDQRKMASVLSRGAISQSIVTNFDTNRIDPYIPVPASVFAGRDLHEIEIETHTKAVERRISKGPSLSPNINVPGTESTATVSPPGSATHPNLNRTTTQEYVDALLNIPSMPSAISNPSPEMLRTTSPLPVLEGESYPALSENEEVGVGETQGETVTFVHDHDEPSANHLDVQIDADNNVVLPSPMSSIYHDAEEGSEFDFATPVVLPGLLDEQDPTVPSRLLAGPSTPSVLPPTPNSAPTPRPKKSVAQERKATRQATTINTMVSAIDSTPSSALSSANPMRMPSKPISPLPVVMPRVRMPRPIHSRSTVIPQLPPPSPLMSSPIPLLPPVPPKPLEVHEGVKCNECGSLPILGVRYKCLEVSCTNYDICSNCFAARVHDETHRLLYIESPKDAMRVDTLGEESDPNNELAIGLRVYSKKDAAATIKGQLRHGNIMRASVS